MLSPATLFILEKAISETRTFIPMRRYGQEILNYALAFVVHSYVKPAKLRGGLDDRRRRCQPGQQSRFYWLHGSLYSGIESVVKQLAVNRQHRRRHEGIGFRAGRQCLFLAEPAGFLSHGKRQNLRCQVKLRSPPFTINFSDTARSHFSEHDGCANRVPVAPTELLAVHGKDP